MNAGTHSNPACTITLVPVDYQGNYPWDEEPDLSRLQNTGQDSVANLSSFAGCQPTRKSLTHSEGMAAALAWVIGEACR